MPVPYSVLITGTSSGIGLELAKYHLNEGHTVYGISRKCNDDLNDDPHFSWLQIDLEDDESIESSLSHVVLPSLFNQVILNAGQIGRIQRLVDADQDELKRLMQVHVWSNQVLLRTLFLKEIVLHQVIGISSGAAVNGSAGWSGYSISKAAFNMWLKLFAHDYPETHFCALAPGLVDTKMQDYLCDEADDLLFPSLGRIQTARGSTSMPTAADLAPSLAQAILKLKSFPSGSFQDIRSMGDI